MTGLQLLVMQERWDLLDVVLEFPDVSLDATDEYNNSILHYVSLQNNLTIMDNLLKLHVNINQKNFEGDEPIHSCIYTDSLECFIRILKKSGRPETHEDHIITHKNYKNENCLTMSIIHRAFKIYSHCLSLMKKLEYIDENQKYPVNYIIDSNNYEFLEAFLARNPNLRITNANKENPLFYCLRHNKTAFFKKLVFYYDEEYLFNKNKEGQSLMHLAALFNNPVAAEILLEYNLEINEPDLKGKTALEYSKDKPDVYHVFTKNR